MSKDGMCVVITGSASGLGAATAASLAKGGARIVINYSSSQKEAEQTADLCRTAGAEVVVVQGDVSRDEDCKKIVAAAAPWGRLDALINNAGTTKHMAHGNLDGLSAEDFQRMFGVNTIGPFQMVRAARSLLEAGANASGRPSAVVNVSSVAGISGVGSSVAYAASKGALNTITYSLARALAPLIRVNTVCPGLYRYAMVHQRPRRGRRQAGPRHGGRESAAQGGVDRGRCRGSRMLSRHVRLEQHDRRTGPHRCGLASGELAFRLFPLAGRGRIASSDAIRVRGSLRESECVESAPRPKPSLRYGFDLSRKRGEVSAIWRLDPKSRRGAPACSR